MISGRTGPAFRYAAATVSAAWAGGWLLLLAGGALGAAEIAPPRHPAVGQRCGPVWTHSGWIGLRQMGHTLSAEYGHVKVWPLQKDL